MDRFIAVEGFIYVSLCHTFKIQYGQIYRLILILMQLMFRNLKSNMDRFIVTDDNVLYKGSTFKIQYGQIYSITRIDIAYDDYEFKIQYGQIYRLKCSLPALRKTNLKSNMDRFIGAVVMSFTYLFVYLKSNMDRFIVGVKGHTCPLWVNLKSNMDRFIVGSRGTLAPCG